MIFTCSRWRCAGWDTKQLRTQDFAEVIAFFDAEIQTGAELTCMIFDGVEWAVVAQWDGVPVADSTGQPVPLLDSVLWFDPSNRWAESLAHALAVTARPREYHG
jgi:hypothetical protein